MHGFLNVDEIYIFNFFHMVLIKIIIVSFLIYLHQNYQLIIL